MQQFKGVYKYEWLAEERAFRLKLTRKYLPLRVLVTVLDAASLCTSMTQVPSSFRARYFVKSNCDLLACCCCSKMFSFVREMGFGNVTNVGFKNRQFPQDV